MRNVAPGVVLILVASVSPGAFFAQNPVKKIRAEAKVQPAPTVPAPAKQEETQKTVRPHLLGATALLMMPPLNLAVSSPFRSAFGGGLTYQLDLGYLRPGLAGLYAKAFAGFVAATSHNTAYSGYTMVVPGLGAGYWLVIHRSSRWVLGPALETGYWHYFSTFRYTDPAAGSTTIYRASKPIIPVGIRFMAEMDGRFLFGVGADYYLFVERAPVHVWGVRLEFAVRL